MSIPMLIFSRNPCRIILRKHLFSIMIVIPFKKKFMAVEWDGRVKMNMKICVIDLNYGRIKNVKLQQKVVENM